MSTRPRQAKLVCRVLGGNLYDTSFDTLKPGRDVMDDIIHAYFRILGQEHDVAILGTYAIKDIIDHGIYDRDSGVFKAERFVGARHVLIGKKQTQGHWNLLYGEPRPGYYQYINPMGTEDSEKREVLQALQRWCGYHGAKAPRLTFPEHPKQHDSHSCGVLVMKFGDAILNGEPLYTVYPARHAGRIAWAA